MSPRQFPPPAPEGWTHKQARSLKLGMWARVDSEGYNKDGVFGWMREGEVAEVEPYEAADVSGVMRKHLKVTFTDRRFIHTPPWSIVEVRNETH